MQEERKKVASLQDLTRQQETSLSKINGEILEKEDLLKNQTIIIADLRTQLNQYLSQQEAINKELERLRAIEKTIINESDLNVIFNVISEEDELLQENPKEKEKMLQENSELKAIINGLNQRIAEQENSSKMTAQNVKKFLYLISDERNI